MNHYQDFRPKYVVYYLFPKKLKILLKTDGILVMAALPKFHIPVAAAFNPRPTDLATFLILLT